MSLESLKGIKLTLDLDDSQFTKNLNKVMRQVNSFSSDLNKLNKALKLDPKNTEVLASKTALLKEKEQEALAVLDKMKGTLENFKAQGIDDADRRMVRLRAAIAEANDEFKKTQAELDKIYKIKRELTKDDLSKFFKETGDAASDLAKKLAPLSAASAAVLTAFGKSAIDYESAFADVKKTIDETDTTKYEDLSDAIIEMSKNVPTSAKEIAKLVGVVGQLGISADDAMKFSKTMVDLGNSTNISAEEAGVAIAQIYNLMGSNIDTVDRFASAIVHLGNNTATTESKIVDMAKYFGAAASTIGLTEQELLGISAALSSVGLDSYGATSLSTIFRNIEVQVANDTKKVNDWAKALGMTGKEFKNAWKEDTVSVIQRLFTALGDVEDKGGSLAKALDDLGIKNLRQLDTMTRLANASELLNETLDLSNKAWQNGTYAVQEANKRYGTTASQLEILRNKTTAIGISLSETILPTITKVLDKVSPLLEKVAKFVSENQHLVVTLLGVGASMSPIMAGISGLSKGIVKIIKWSQVGVPLVTKFSAVLGGLALVFGGIAAVTAMAMDKERGEDEVLKKLIADNEAFNTTLNEGLSARVTELDYYNKLANELSTLYDQNGKVKEGYEDRVNYIKTELVNAGVIEKNTLDELIKKNEDYTNAVSEGVEKRKAAEIVATLDDQQLNALQTQQTAIEWLSEHADEIKHANDVLNGAITGIGAIDVSNAQQVLSDYAQMQEQYEKSNALLANIEGMQKAYDDKQWEEVINLYNQGVYDLVGKGTEEVEGELDEFALSLDELKEQDDGTPLFEATIQRTIDKFNEMVKAAGLDIAEIERLLGLGNSYRDSLNGVITSMQSAGGVIASASGSRMRSGGFSSGGFTFNSTINVSTTQAVTKSDVRSWGVTLADVINEELGKRL